MGGCQLSSMSSMRTSRGAIAPRWGTRVLAGGPRALLPGLRDYPGAAGTLALAAFWCAVALWVCGYAFMAFVPTSGDEITYAKHAAAMAEFVRLRGSGFEKTLAIVVENGWFMPGVSVGLVPVFLLAAHPSLPLIRLYIAVATFLLWIWSTRQVHRQMGGWYSFPLLFFPALAVTWQFFSSTAWGDLPAGLVLAAIFARTWSIACQIMNGDAPHLRGLVVVELLLVAATYLRGPTLLVAIAIHIFLLVVLLLSGRRVLTHLARLGPVGLSWSCSFCRGAWQLVGNLVLP